MKKDFLAGLVILLPVVLTIIIVRFFINLLTKPFLGILTAISQRYEWLSSSFNYLPGEEIKLVISKLLILTILFFILLAIGFLGRLFIVNTFLQIADKVLHYIPLINKIYKSIQEVMHTLFKTETTAFSQVVLVPFPHANSYSVGLITKDSLPQGSDKEHMKLVSVFVCGTPNPTMGFMLLFKREQLVLLDMKVEDAMKFIISCGVIYSGFNKNPSANHLT